MDSMIFVKTNTDGTGDGFEQLVTLMGNHGTQFYRTGSGDGLIGRDDVVLMKINSQWDERGGTNTDLLKSIIQAVLRHPEGFRGEVVVSDNGQAQFGAKGSGGSLDWEDNNARDRSQSVQRVVDEIARTHRVSTVLWDTFTSAAVKEYSAGDYGDGFVVLPRMSRTGARISYPKFKTRYGTHVSFKEGIWDDGARKYDSDGLKVISVPVLKAHSGYQVTACVKHYMGTTSDKLTAHDSHTAIAKGFMGTQMAGTRPPVLNVLDAIWINPVRGPRAPYSQAVEKRMVAASTDPVALDVWAAKNVLMPAAKEAGKMDYAVMDPAANEAGTFGQWLRLSMNEMLSAGMAVTMDEDRIKVFVQE